MNFKVDLTTKQQQLLQDAGISIENKIYSKKEIKKCELTITDYIMSHSSKNGDISKQMNKYNHIIEVLVENE